ncbi:MAG: class II aldolase/adducin family protein [Deltaproteobacteria bacterium]|nr:class II aldolase/adducin family protein [Candidatus Anaeroferrophillacea bacterium]
MDDRQRQEICDYGCRLLADRLTTGTGGNLSVIDRHEGVIAISPSGIPYPDLEPEDVSIITRGGEHVAGRPPSSEWQLHTTIYEQRPDVGAVVHTHSRYATTLAVLGEELPPCHYLIAVSGADRIRVAPYATFGTAELARIAAEHLGNDWCILLANHGLLAAGRTLTAAYNVALYIEEVAEIHWHARLAGTPQLLSAAQLAAARERFASYGVRGAGKP